MANLFVSFLYNILLLITAPIWGVMAWMRSRRRAEKPNWKERMGEFPIHWDTCKPLIWVHTVSVGEVVAAIPVLQELQLQWPEAQILQSVTTSTGHQVAKEKCLDAGLVDQLVYFPIDIARFQMIAMVRARPVAVVIFETELWFNFVQFAKSFGAGTLLVNGRLSDRSAPKMSALKFFYRHIFDHLDRILVQTPLDADRFLMAGAKRPEIFGNTKFDEALGLDSAMRQKQRADFGVADEDFLIVVGSTRGDEEVDFVLAALSRLDRAGVRVILAPRHIENAAEILAKVQGVLGDAGLRSAGSLAPVLVLDTYGELGNLYAAADLAVIGGGFSPLGGQNLIQPLAWGIPVLHGEHMTNFKSASEAALTAGASMVVRSSDELFAALEALHADPARRTKMGSAGKKLVEESRGASARYATEIIKEAKSSRAFQRLLKRKSAKDAKIS